MSNPIQLTKGMTLDPKMRDAMMHLPWQEAHPQCDHRVRWAIYQCGHEFYNGSKQEVIALVLRGSAKRRFYNHYCPQCFGRWMVLPASMPYEVPRKTMPRYNRNLPIPKFRPRRVA